MLHSAGARSRASLACHVPAAGVPTSAYQKYGGPPRLSRDFAATLPSGAIDQNDLMDIPSSDVVVGKAPIPPEGYEIARIDVVVRLRRKR